MTTLATTTSMTAATSTTTTEANDLDKTVQRLEDEKAVLTAALQVIERMTYMRAKFYLKTYFFKGRERSAECA